MWPPFFFGVIPTYGVTTVRHDNATDPATAAQLDLNGEANKTHLHIAHGILHHLSSNQRHNTPTQDVSSLNRDAQGCIVPKGRAV